MCCCPESDDDGIKAMADGLEIDEEMKHDKESRYFLHPSDSQIALTTHTPLYIPGKIIHVVRNHPKDSGYVLLIYTTTLGTIYAIITVLCNKSREINYTNTL